MGAEKGKHDAQMGVHTYKLMIKHSSVTEIYRISENGATLFAPFFIYCTLW